MPTLAIFYGIEIHMFHRDHGAPHVHAKYHSAEAQVRIADGEIPRGSLPPTARRLVKRWVLRYKAELESNLRKGSGAGTLGPHPGLEDDDQDHLE